MAYNLSPRTKQAAVTVANYFGPRHGIKNAYGWRAVGSVPNSDHPKGTAIDFMTSDKSQGDNLAADVVSNASAFGVTYVIWYRRIWKPGVGWKSYVGPSPHTDHVHVSVSETGGTGGFTPVANPLVPDSIEDTYSFLTDPGTWRKAGLYLLAFVLIVIGFLLLMGIQPKALRKAVK